MIRDILGKLKHNLFPNLDGRNFLLNKMPKNARCAEIGAWQGDFTKRILAKTNPKKLFIIDPYHFSPEYEEALYGGVSGSQEKMDSILKSVENRFEKEIRAGQLEFIRDFSEAGLSKLDDGSMDWIYIDGDHTYDAVKKDLELSWQKTKSGGFVTGDDYNLEGWWEDGVTKAVNEFIEKNKDKIICSTRRKTQFIIQKR